MSAYRFPPPVTGYACGMHALVLSRIEQHREEFGGRRPLRILLHDYSYLALNEDAYKRFSRPQGHFVDGVEIAICPCQDAFAPDYLKRADGRWEVL